MVSPSLTVASEVEGDVVVTSRRGEEVPVE
jgi:hypothetical protein